MKKVLCGLILCLSLGLMLYDIRPVYAQSEDGEDFFMLEEVTVTATKREENLQNVAISASSLVGESLQKTGRTVLQEMLRDSAGVEIRGTAQDAGIFIRGIGENTFGMGVEGNVALSVNGVYTTKTQINRMSHSDVARVEVSRGPDSTLNGRTAMGGSVSIITNEPTHSLEGSGNITVGNFDLYNTQGVINVPVGEDFALRTAVTTVKRGGHLTNGGGDLDSFNGRLRGLYEPNTELKVILTAEHTTTGGMGRGISSYTTPIDLSKPFTTPKGAFYNPTMAPTYEDTSSDNYYVDITYDFGWASLYFQPTYQSTTLDSALYNRGYTANSTDDEPDTWNLLNIARDQEQTSYELRLTSPDKGNKIKWLTGFYYFNEKTTQEFLMATPNQTTMPEMQYPEIDSETNWRETEDTAVYATATYDITDTISLTAGGRYTRDKKDRPEISGSTMFYTLDDGLDNQTTGERVYFAITAETATSERVDYKISLQKELSPESMVYALVSTGWKGGGFNILPADSSIWNSGYSQFYDPEYLTSFEIGTKNQLFDNTLRINASAFYYNYQDVQLNFRGTPIKSSTGVDPDWRRGVIQNAGKAVSFGFEVESDYLLTPQDRFKLNISYLNTEIKETDFSPLYYLEGMELPESPNWRVSPSYQHKFDFAGRGEVLAEIDGTYVSESMYQIPKETGDPYNKRDAYFKANASLSYFSRNGGWSLSGYVRNLFDKQTYDAISLPTVYSGFSNVTFIAAEPRTFGVTLSAYF